MTWGIGITRIELDTHRCQTLNVCLVLVQRAFIGEVQKQVDFINRTEVFKTLLNVAKIEVY